MSEPTWISLLPPLLAITLAIISRQVYLSLAGGIWLGHSILMGWNPVSGLVRAIDETVSVLSDPGDAKVILFTLVIGSLIATVESSGGVRGFVSFLETRRWVTTPRRARLLAWFAGITLFIESNINVLVAGSVSRPLFDRFKVSREKLAYIIDSASAPTCIMIPLNAWGAYNLGILAGLGIDNPVRVFLSAVVLNFYAMAALILAGLVAYFGWDIGPMKKAEARTQGGELLWPNAKPLMDESILSPSPNEKIPPRAINMVIPIAAMVLMMPLSLFITGDGNLMEGSGSTSVLWAVMTGLAVAWVLLLVQKGASVDDLTRTGLKGAGGLVPMALILFLALSLGDVAVELGTGQFVASVTQGLLPPVVFLPLVFLVGAGIAFSIGSSWGTFAIMLPIAVPAAEAMGLPLAPFVAASLAGGIFGDHSSPISDTTIISSMAAATDHIDHVRTQIPYALTAGTIAAIGFAIVGATL